MRVLWEWITSSTTNADSSLLCQCCSPVAIPLLNPLPPEFNITDNLLLSE